jgi:molybdopterin-guanine dinucleotide biosynthesis protein A
MKPPLTVGSGSDRTALRSPVSTGRRSTVPCTGAIVAGGSSSRFAGAAKGLEVVGGRRIIDRVADALWPVVDHRLLIANAPDARDWLPGVHTMADEGEERASLVGIRSALTAAEGAALVVAWDMPFVPRTLLARLRELGESRRSAAIPRHADRIEPLCAYYPESVLDVARAQVERHEMRLTAFVHALPAVTYLEGDELASVADATRAFLNVNTAEDLARARAVAASA